MISSRFRFLAGWTLTVLLCVPSAPADERMSQLKYNNPGLLVDLGVGLWAWPLPMDFNDDGLMDLVGTSHDRFREDSSGPIVLLGRPADD